jgi:uncharacterized protein (TIGR02266 family)
MGMAESVGRPETEAFERMRLRMRALAAVASPHVDPRALAVRALLVTDLLGQPDLLRKVDALGRAGVCEPRSVDDLRMAARALLHVLSKRGEPTSATGGPASGDARAAALRLRREGVDALEAVEADDARLWLDVLRQPFEDVDLVFDLRAMALLCETFEGQLPEGDGAKDRPQVARQAADALEAFLISAPREWTDWLDRAFSLTLALYEDVCRIGRFLVVSDGPALAFPSPSGIARGRRKARAAASAVHPVRPGPPPLPAEEEPEEVGELDLEAAPEPAPPPTPALTPAPAPAPTSSPPSQRRAERLPVELEVSLFSDSNFYVGFTENLSESGVFVATYFVRPLGSRVEMCVRIHGRVEPLILRGEVRWIREFSPTSDGCPGMGIQFDAVSDDDRAEIATFLSTRDPLFFA